MISRTVRTLQGLSSIRDHWDRWQPHIDSDRAQFELICELRPEVECPFVTVIEHDGEPYALLAGRLESARITPAIGYFQPFSVPARVLTTLHEGVMGHSDERAASEMVKHVRAQLDLGVADAAHFSYLPEESPLLDALLREGPRWLCDRTPRWSTHREMNLPTGGSVMEQKLRSKARTRIRRKEKALETAFPGKVEWRYLRDFDDVPGLCSKLEEVASRAYQRGLGAGFFDNEEFRRRYALFASHGRLRVSLLEVDGRVRAFWCGAVHQGAFHSSTTAYDPALGDYVVGTQNFIRLADALVREGVQRFDFGLGDARYKESFGDRSWRETSIWMFAPTAKGVFLMFVLRTSFAIDTMARRIVKRAGLTEKLKALWRRGKTPADTDVAAEA